MNKFLVLFALLVFEFSRIFAQVNLISGYPSASSLSGIAQVRTKILSEIQHTQQFRLYN
ncbi:MAG: hypothetical protein JNK69_13910 [Saprospiraceae bacterium]|nr:hypothetical protein [Saprospiraceae bacterium]